MIAALLVLDLLAATPDTARGEARFALDAGTTSGVGANAFDGDSAGIELGFRLFRRPLLDDATPRDLQPFLERASFLRARLGGGSALAPWSGVAGDPVTSAAELHVLVDGELYLSREIAVAAGSGYSVTGASSLGRHVVPFALEVALRPGDLRIGLGFSGGYSLEAPPTPVTASGLSAALTASLRAVLLEHIDIAGRIAIGSVFAARVDIGWYPSRTLGLVVNAGGTSAPRGAQTLDLGVGMSWWYGGGNNMTLGWSPGWSSADGGAGGFRSRFELVFTVRK